MNQSQIISGSPEQLYIVENKLSQSPYYISLKDETMNRGHPNARFKLTLLERERIQQKYLNLNRMRPSYSGGQGIKEGTKLTENNKLPKINGNNKPSSYILNTEQSSESEKHFKLIKGNTRSNKVLMRDAPFGGVPNRTQSSCCREGVGNSNVNVDTGSKIKTKDIGKYIYIYIYYSKSNCNKSMSDTYRCENKHTLESAHNSYICNSRGMPITEEEGTDKNLRYRMKRQFVEGASVIREGKSTKGFRSMYRKSNKGISAKDNMEEQFRGLMVYILVYIYIYIELLFG